MSDLYDRLHAGLLELHKKELDELSRRFGAGKSIVFLDEKCTVKTDKIDKKKRKWKVKGLPKNIVEPTVRELIQKHLSDTQFTVSDCLNKMHSHNREIWSRMKKSHSMSPTLHKLFGKGFLRKINQDNGINHYDLVKDV